MNRFWCGVDLGTLAYPEAIKLQHRFVEAVLRRTGDCSGMVLMVEHLPVFTLGQRGGLENLRVSTSFLENNGIAVIPSERGGDLTYQQTGTSRRPGIRQEEGYGRETQNWGASASASGEP